LFAIVDLHSPLSPLQGIFVDVDGGAFEASKRFNLPCRSCKRLHIPSSSSSSDLSLQYVMPLCTIPVCHSYVLQDQCALAVATSGLSM
jgi:hypothetical protein